MPKLQDERMQLIGAAILAQANQEARALIDKANDMREAEITDCENGFISIMFERVQDKAARIRIEANKTRAKSEIEAHRTLLGYRAEKAGAVFQNVCERLSRYAESPGYKTALMTRAKLLIGRYDNAHSTVLVRTADMELGREIQKLLGVAGLEADESIRLGGFKLRNTAARVLVDETLDERLEEQKLWFLENCGMKIM